MASKTLPHFFDITSTLPLPSTSWSPNTLRTRLVLNYKGVRYTQSYISYPDIAPLLRSLSVPALPSRRMPYTLPALLHPASLPSTASGAMNDSWPLALHLESTFPAPDYPSIFPSGDASVALALAVQKILGQAIARGMNVLLPKIPAILDERGAEYFHRTRSEWFGSSLADLSPKGAALAKTWKGLEGEVGILAEMLRGVEVGGKGKGGPFFEGERVGYADFLVVAWLAWWERGDREGFDRLCRVGKGEFARLWEACKPWVDGQGEEKVWDVPKI